MEKQKTIERLGRIREYENQKRQEELEEKEKKQEEYKKQKEKLKQIKFEMSMKLDKEKQEIINKFDEFFLKLLKKCFLMMKNYMKKLKG